MSTDGHTSDDPIDPGAAFKKRMEIAYTDDYLRIMGIEHYRQGYFTPDLAPDDLPAALDRHVEVLLGPLALGPQHVVLELGCNAGATTVQLVRRYGCTVHAIDIVPDMVRAAEERTRLAGVADRAHVSLMDARLLQFPDATFDVVVGIEVVYHFEDKAACLREIARVLKPGGQLVLAEYLLSPTAPRLGARLVQSILESDRIEDADGYQKYLAAAGFAPPRITDHAEQTVVATTRAFRSERYRNRIRAYGVVYFGVLFALLMPAAYWLWEQMFRRGHARYVFLYSERRDPRER
jgi:cyclopropane fatty-acyl-phospholipid synthase-like methyltransferase